MSNSISSNDNPKVRAKTLMQAGGCTCPYFDVTEDTPSQWHGNKVTIVYYMVIKLLLFLLCAYYI